jgi:DNA-binding NarL/FixJ family response regulator
MLDAAGTRVEDANPTWSTWLLLVLTRAGIAAGRLDEADDWATRAADHAAALRLPSGGVRGACARAEVLLARDDADAAAELATEAVATADRVGAPRDAAEARLLAGRALAAAGKRPQAVDMLQRAAADAARGCAFQIRDAGAAELRTLGVRLPTAGRGGQRANGEAALSKREREIAELVAEGRSNKQVAAALFLSDRTVEYHLSAVYKKLGVRSRTQLAATLGRAG